MVSRHKWLQLCWQDWEDIKGQVHRTLSAQLFISSLVTYSPKLSYSSVIA